MRENTRGTSRALKKQPIVVCTIQARGTTPYLLYEKKPGCHPCVGNFFTNVFAKSSYPGQNDNRWINLVLEGTKCNRAAIGAKIKVTFKENGIERSVYRDVNSGGSFGSNPLMQHIGIGRAAVIEKIEIKWPVSNAIQVFKNIQPGQTDKIKERKDLLTRINMNPADFTTTKSGLISCGLSH